MTSALGSVSDLVSRAVSYGRAETSLAVQGPISSERYEKRIAECRSCDMLAPHPTVVGYCRACGCADWSRSAIATKAKMPAAKCPLGRW